MSGWNPQSCRACLETDVKLFHLHVVGLAELFGFIAGCPVVPSDGLPQYVCYYCRALLLKFKEFRLKCQNTMVFFRDTGQEIPTDHTNSFGKTKYCIPLSVSIPEFIDLGYSESDVIQNYNFNSNFIDSNNDENWKDNEEKSNKLCDIKNEDSTDDIKMVHIKSEFAEENFVTVEPSNIFNKVTEENIITVESPNIFNEATEENIVTDDSSNIFNEETNIPLRPKKDRNVKARNTKRKRTEANDKARNTKRKRTEANDKDKQKQNTKAKKKKCNRYNEKFEEDFEEFNTKYNVKVVCLSKEEQLQKVQQRKESDEYKHSRFSCDICYRWFMSENAHSRHMMAHDPSSGTFVCEICQMRYSSRMILNRHVRKHKKSFICELCGQVNNSITRAKFHSEWHRGLKFNCQVCQKEFKANSTYLNHMRESHKSVSCTDCGESFLGTNELLKHTNTVHGNMKFECDTCAVAFQSSDALLTHKADDTCRGKTYPCRHCGANFPYKRGLHAHIASLHADAPGLFVCEQCGAVFSSDRNLSVHFSYNHTKHVKHHSRRGDQQSTTQSKPVGRAARPPKTQPRKKLNNNAKSKEGFPSYLCEICAKRFVCPTKLKSHITTHSLEKPYPCPMCPKSFRTKVAREVHTNVHTGARPYKCRLCPEMFKSYAQRYKHSLMVHTGERRHKCTMCEKTYVVAYDLKEHVRYAHLHHPRPPRKNPRNHAKNAANFAKNEHKTNDNDS